MRVIHVLCDLSGGGAERLVLDLCKHAGTGHSVITVQSGGALTEAFRDAGISVQCAGRRRKRLGIRAIFRMARWMKGADVVHTHLWAGDMWGRMAATIAKVPLISTEHNIDRAEPWWKHQLKVHSSGLNHQVTAVSTPVGNYWEALGLRHIDVVHNGVDLARFSAPHIGGGGRSLLAVGRLVPQKGFDVLIKAISELDCTLIIAGEGPERARLMAMASERVCFVGQVDDVPSLMAQADLLVVPSLWEGFGLVALEGMAAGVPVIASNTGGLTTLTKDAGILTIPNCARSLRKTIKKILDNRPLSIKMSRDGRKRAAEFSLSETAATYARLYEGIMSI